MGTQTSAGKAWTINQRIRLMGNQKWRQKQIDRMTGRKKTVTDSLWRPKKDSGEDVMFIRCYIIFLSTTKMNISDIYPLSVVNIVATYFTSAFKPQTVNKDG